MYPLILESYSLCLLIYPVAVQAPEPSLLIFFDSDGSPARLRPDPSSPRQCDEDIVALFGIAQYEPMKRVHRRVRGVLLVHRR